MLHLTVQLLTPKGLPPALIITDEFDVLRSQVDAYAHKLIEAGVLVTATTLDQMRGSSNNK